ncbi:MAG: M48 family metallopeptidase [Marinosulfonomonas sp.]|nr:M48 family metallopeptidase [Marinosulfonomonas sp.]
MRKIVMAVLALTLSGCVTVTGPDPQQNRPAKVTTVAAPPPVSQNRAARNFLAVVQRVEPVAERECRVRTSGVNCDFNIVVDSRKGQPSNAYQTLDKNGRPVIAFTSALIAEARNQDELAFVLGHEAAHHIRGHIPKTQQSAVAGAVVGGLLAAVMGAGDAGIQEAQRLGGAVGARTYSKNYELEADELGTVITVHSGYDPIKGAAFFSRIPDPGDRFLGSHPPNAARIQTVRRTAANM